MTKEIKLLVHSRTEQNGKASNIRQADYIPAVIYGPGVASRSLKVKKIDFERVFNLAGESNLINLTIDGEKPVKALVYDVQTNPVKNRINHIDFYQVDMTKKITTEIPLHFIGESKAIKESAGVLVKNFTEVEVECLPGDLVDHIDVDISRLQSFDDVIKIADLKLPPDMELSAEAEEVVAIVTPPQQEEEPVAAEVPAAQAEAGEAGEEKAKEPADQAAEGQPAKE